MAALTKQVLPHSSGAVPGEGSVPIAWYQIGPGSVHRLACRRIHESWPYGWTVVLLTPLTPSSSLLYRFFARSSSQAMDDDNNNVVAYIYPAVGTQGYTSAAK